MMFALFSIVLWAWAWDANLPDAHSPILPALIIFFAVRDIVEGRF